MRPSLASWIFVHWPLLSMDTTLSVVTRVKLRSLSVVADTYSRVGRNQMHIR